MRQRIGKWMAVAALTALLAACGSGGDGDPAAVTVGADGGSVAGDGGVKVIVPPGAMAQDVTIRVAQDDTGAPPLPGWSPAAGPMVAITPHGAEFNEPVTVRLPVPAGLQLQDNQRLLIAKAQPGGEWEVLGDTVTRDGQLEVAVRSFSYFAPVVITYLPVPGVTVLPQPYGFSSMTLTCDGAPCANPELVRSIPMSVTVTPNGGLLPASCVNPQIGLWQDGVAAGGVTIGSPEPAGSGTVFTRSFTMNTTLRVVTQLSTSFDVRLICISPSTNERSYLVGTQARLQLRGPDTIYRVPQVVQFPTALQRAPGEPVALRGVLTGGASIRSGGVYRPASPTDRALVYLERKEPSDTVWRIVLTRTQNEANASPLAGSLPWAFWGYDFELGAAAAADNGAQFRLRTCYRVPDATSEACNIGPLATLTVVQQTVAPSFTQQPRALLVQPGQTASFSVVAGGTPAPTLQWQTRAANATGDWVDVTDGSGATSANYTTAVLQLGDNGRQYRVLARNAAGSTPTETVTVSVADALVAPGITTQPAALTVLAGSEAVFAVTAGGTGPLSYQWYFGDAALASGNGPQLRIANASGADRGLYSVRVSNGAGSVLSERVALAVTDVPSGGTPVAPTIATQPAAVAVTVGNTATFGVGVSGSGPFSFQWRRNDVAIAGATAATHTIPGVTPADAGNYSVVVSNGVGSVTSQAATLGVAPALTPEPAAPEAPTINAQPLPVVVAPGMGVILAVGTQGSGPLAYQWSYNGAPLAGQTGAQLLIAAATAGDAGSYQVTVSNAAGSVASNAVALTVIGAPAISAQPGAVAAAVGATATFGVTATGDALRYQWLRNGEAIPGASAASYTTPVLALADSGAVYSVVVFNGAGLVFSGSATLSVTAAVEPTPLLATAVAAGFGSSYAVDVNDGKVWAWGYLVDPVTGGYKAASPWATSPVQVLGLSGVSRVVVVSETGNVYALHVDGTVSAWGRNDVGQLGDGTTTERALPVKVLDGSAGAGSPPIAGICQIAAGNSALAMAPCDGHPTMIVGLMSRTNFGGATGSGLTPNGALARAVPGLPGGEVTALAMPDAAANAEGGLLVAYSDNGVWAWGAQRNNSLGAGAAETVAGTGVAAVEVTSTFNPPGRLVNRIEMGRDFTLVRWAGGAVLGVGSNTEGQLGNGTFTSRTTLDYVSSSVSLGNFSVGQLNVAALVSGDVWIWGWHNGETFSRPTQLTTGGGFAQLSLGDQHGLLIDTAGRVHAWGDGSFGALGTGAAQAAQPVPVIRR